LQQSERFQPDERFLLRTLGMRKLWHEKGGGDDACALQKKSGYAGGASYPSTSGFAKKGRKKRGNVRCTEERSMTVVEKGGGVVGAKPQWERLEFSRIANLAKAAKKRDNRSRPTKKRRTISQAISPGGRKVLSLGRESGRACLIFHTEKKKKGSSSAILSVRREKRQTHRTVIPL